MRKPKIYQALAISGRLRELFLEVWHSLPAKDRRAIWRRKLVSVALFAPPADDPGLIGRAYGALYVSDPNTMAMAFGCRIDIADDLGAHSYFQDTDADIRGLMAHELAHVFLGHCAELVTVRFKPLNRAERKAEKQREQDVANQCARWGYPQDYKRHRKARPAGRDPGGPGRHHGRP